MQTFLPYADFVQTAKVLDNKRLGKQRVEAYQILNTLMGNSKGWVNHPAVKMWKGYESVLCLYGIAICNEWINRGFKDTLLERFIRTQKNYINIWPSWLGNENFHASHRSNLLRKDYVFYSKYGWVEDSTLPYVWPV